MNPCDHSNTARPHKKHATFPCSRAGHAEQEQGIISVIQPMSMVWVPTTSQGTSVYQSVSELQTEYVFVKLHKLPNEYIEFKYSEAYMNLTNGDSNLLLGGTAVITGAGSGIGASLGHAAAAQSRSVVLADIQRERVEQVAEAIQSEGGYATPYEIDVSDAASVEGFAQHVFEEHDDIRLLVNNAGIEATGRIWEMGIEHWRKIMSVNLDGVFNCIHAFVPPLIARKEPAHIVNVASLAA